MPGPAASATSVGAGSPRAGGGARAGGAGGVRQRKAGGGGGGGGGGKSTPAMRAGGTSSGGMWRFYTDDSPGIKVRPDVWPAGRSHLVLAGWPRACPGDVPPLHRLRVHAPHLGQVQQGLGWPGDGEQCLVEIAFLPCQNFI